MQKIITKIDKVDNKLFDNLSGECFVIDASLDDEFCRKFVEKCAIEDRVVLFYGQNAINVSKKNDADGVVLDLGAEGLKDKIIEIRKILGKDKYVGLFTRNRKHESMLVSEVEPDFVVFKVWKDGFEGVKNLTDWYQDFFLIQSVAWLVDEDIDIKSLKTDFIVM